MTLWPSPAEPGLAGGGSLEEIGARLRVARAEKKIGVREMARRIGVSPSFVSQVELGKTRPSVGTLFAFISELGLSLAELMSDPPAEPIFLKPFQDKRDWFQNPSLPVRQHPAQALRPAEGRPRIQLPGVMWERLTIGDDPLVEFLMVTYEPGGESCSEKQLMHHGGHEYGHIISGYLSVQVGFDHYELGPDDSIDFDSTTPHRLANSKSSAESCKSIWAVVGRRVDTRNTGSDSPIGHVPHLHQ
jgi:transcriptional regulator with XRE-family HTH domain